MPKQKGADVFNRNIRTYISISVALLNWEGDNSTHYSYVDLIEVLVLAGRGVGV